MDDLLNTIEGVKYKFLQVGKKKQSPDSISGKRNFNCISYAISLLEGVGIECFRIIFVRKFSDKNTINYRFIVILSD